MEKNFLCPAAQFMQPLVWEFIIIIRNVTKIMELGWPGWRKCCEQESARVTCACDVACYIVGYVTTV